MHRTFLGRSRRVYATQTTVAQHKQLEEIMRLEAEQDITPDAWVIIEIKDNDTVYSKVLSGWSGSYLYGDSWRMSSRIQEINIQVNQDFYTVTTESSSTYRLYKSRQGLRMSNAGVYNELKEKFADKIEIVEL